MNHPFVAVLMGSDSDLATVQETLDVLDRLQIPWQVKIIELPTKHVNLLLRQNQAAAPYLSLLRALLPT